VILPKRMLLVGGLVLAASSLAGCKTEKPPKSPDKDKSLDAKNGDELQEEGEEGEEEETGTDTSVTDSSPLALEVSSSEALKVKVGTPVSITFTLKNATGKDVAVGMISSPSGATVEVSGSTVVYKWQTPTGGTYPLKFLLRDLGKCEDAEGSASKCSVSSSDVGLTAKSYDVTSEEFSLDVETDDNLGLPGTGNGGLGGGGNAQLIQQIIALLGGGGGGGIQTLLQGLSNGQLQNLLGQLQNGGGGGGIAQLIGLLGNL
jgi:hypothetical protein